MPSTNIKVAVEDVDDSKNIHSFPEWTQEDDSDDMSSIAHQQRLRFRAAIVAGRQRLRSLLREETPTPTRRAVSQEAYRIRAMLEERKFGDVSKGVGAAASAFASGAGQAVADVAHGIGNSAGAAASAFAEGKGFLGAAGAAAESVADGIGKGVNDAAGAAASANGAFASAVAGSDDSDDSDNGEKTKTTTKDEPSPTQTSLPPPPASQTATTDLPEVTATTPASKPPQQTTQPPSPSSGQKQPEPPASTQQPIDNVPPPKAEEPPFGKPDDFPSGNPSDAKPTSSTANQKLTISTLVPGAAIITTQSGTRLLLTPIISGTLPAATSGTSKVYSGPDFDSTTPFAVGPDPTTMMTSISPTGGLRTGESNKPSNNNNPKDKGDDGSIGAHDQSHQQSGASPLIAIVVLGICAFLAIGFFFWRRRKQQREFGSNNRDAGDMLSAPPRSPLDKVKRTVINLASRIPFVRDKLWSTNRWENIDDPYGIAFPEKRGVSAAGFPGMTEPPRIMVQTTFTQRSSIVSKFKAAVTGGALPSFGSSNKATSTREGADAGLSAAAQANGGTSGQRAASSDPNPLGLSPFIAPENNITRESAQPTSQDRAPLGANHGPKPSFSSTAPQYNLTLQSTYGAGRRISELSSLSSGFGDGDIIIPPQPTRKSTASLGRLQGRAYTGAENTSGGSGSRNRNRSSTATTATARSNSSARRDTVYTEASEDFPPRFRTVSSWVNQQSGRVKRQEQRMQDTANKTGAPPPVPPIPPEQDFRLMMPDGEEPRRVEDTNVNTGGGTGGDWGAETKSMLKVVIGTAH